MISSWPRGTLKTSSRNRFELTYIVIAEGDVFLTKFWKSIKPRIKHGLNTDPNNQRIASQSVFNPCFIRGQEFRLAASPRYDFAGIVPFLPTLRVDRLQRELRFRPL